MKRSLVTLTLVASALVACGTSVTLQPRSAAVLAGVDLSGQWLLRRSGDESLQQIAKAGADAAGGQPIIRSRRDVEARKPRNARGGLVHVFLETGEALKITQTPDGLFISFDRAIVEEYRFGEMREVNVGPVIAQRASGWEGASYVIQTLDNDGVILTEEYRLEDSGTVLIRDILVSKGESIQLDVRQVFDRR
jgi:hypothetical protein